MMMNPDDTDELHGEELVYYIGDYMIILAMHFDGIFKNT